ncbi:DNA-deoxyinosine glycosylase [Campylobacter sp. RM9344]|uniref:DNA-deoxyinosine glycosylase n=1 Tax=Campylobacter californiensis TaxID=1032243 RepID=A0AAW3ZWI0_9BACT|nr:MULTISPECIES: DNA-deoxyinosine glycosylase [unclassified Campylobacter]MBE2984681.1 DNA-deoxyinosine glycosylase [Campylobacter sp. RM6883]MBE2994597.1 DNA-deoxyinosine glycosylase [Campylobacter sp. RM6913]MBE3029123.1 DNA-deoxyinosine glycosylase [Campylobacter sp. RM9344]MBE3608114.1 DNA-deoxyinosine glycosylase [Campylobacter sp. RM9337]QCD50405.1 G:T/U mismatch-specific DNA glycosylase [Campylobacter sp. RM6914]
MKSASYTHPFEPIFDKNSQILILGSFPSVISREAGFYYSHPQNRFYKVLASLFNEQIPKETNGKIEFLLKHKIALYDAALMCEIKGSSDADMRRIIPVNLSPIFDTAKIRQVYANGGKAYEICNKFLKDEILQATGKNVTPLPSTSPRNAKFSLERLIKEYAVILNK